MTDLARDGIPAMLMRGGTSRGVYFLRDDLPTDPVIRDRILLEIMGSPDPTQIDGVGGGHPLRSKVAVVSRSAEPGVDLDYLFLQVGVDTPTVVDTQTCGNIIAGVGPFAVERGLVPVDGEETSVRIRLVNTGDLAVETFPTPGGRPSYEGDTAIDGVPGTAASIEIEMGGGIPTKALFPSGHPIDFIDGHEATLVDNGMPVVLLRASEFGVRGDETPEELEARVDVYDALESIRRKAGPLMGLGEVDGETVPKMFLLSAPVHGGAISTRAFIPKRVHTAIGVLMAASVAAAVCVPETVAAELAVLTPEDVGQGGGIAIEHPSGGMVAKVRIARDGDGEWLGTSTSIRTARKLFDGRIYPRSH